jgi:hypothetical protein
VTRFFAVACLAATLACTSRGGLAPAPETQATSATASVAHDADPVPRADPIAWQLAVDPSTTLPMSRRGELALWIVARNSGSHPADTRRDRLEYLVNGQPSMMLAMAFGNGVREGRWSELAPGDTIREARGTSGDPSFGESLFPAPGDYVLELRQDGHPVADLRMQITPR